ncbi:MAG: hypothetical protein HUU22_11575 [Phycisphaerae bacterium]|nr:hypothetical protein [Phycisphaerae bacterium]NUQ46662.1 hypothetical protein [Phycisphaerae bacterium]
MRSSAVLLSILLLLGGCLNLNIRGNVSVGSSTSGGYEAIGRPSDLGRYHGIRVESVRVRDGVRPPGDLPGQIRRDFMRTFEKRTGLTETASPALVLATELVELRYEGGSEADREWSSQTVLHARLLDAETGRAAAEARLICRVRGADANDPDRISRAATKALRRWLEDGGVRMDKEKDEEEEDES